MIFDHRCDDCFDADIMADAGDELFLYSGFLISFLFLESDNLLVMHPHNKPKKRGNCSSCSVVRIEKGNKIISAINKGDCKLMGSECLHEL